MLEAPRTECAISSVDESPIFVIGTGRSGTTLLRQMLNAHPRIHITHEAGFYSYTRHAPSHLSATEWLERYFETFSFAWLGLSPQEIRDTLPQHLPRERIVEAYRAVMRLKARKEGKERYGDKNPLDTHNLASIFKDFADPRVIYIMRDPRPTVQSYNRMPFGTSSTLLNSCLCRVQFNHIQPYWDRILEVRLEDLTADPRQVMESVLRFVGEPWDEAVLDHVNQAATHDVPPLPWFADATRGRPSHAVSAGSWQAKMAPAWIRIIEWLNRPGFERYGYEPARLEREPRLLEFVAALLADVPGIAAAVYRLLSFKRKLDRHFRSQQRLDPQHGMEESLRMNPAAWRHYPKFEMPRVPQLPASRGSA